MVDAFLMKDLLRYLDSLSKLDYASYIVTIAKIAPKQIGALIHFQKFLLSKGMLYLYRSTMWFACNAVVITGLVLLFSTWICWKSYRNGYVGMWVQYLSN